MKKNMGEKGRKLMDAIKADKKITLIVCIGLLGMLLSLASEFIHLPKKQEAETPSENIQTEYSYAEDLEKRLTNIVSSISGAGKTKVMVTLENGVESVYAADEKQSVERSSGEKTGGVEVNEKSNTENEYIILQSNGSRDEGLVIKVIQPKIRGVAIVCEGGDSAYVQQRITQAVTAVLDIGASRVSIARMAD